MESTVLKPIILVTEGATDIAVICSLIDTAGRIIYPVEAGGYHNIASTLRTMYLMYGDDYNYIAAFDSDSEMPSVKQEKLSMIRYLSKADMHTDIIGVFCFSKDIESELGISFAEKRDKGLLVQALQQRGDQMRQSETIREIQQFIDGLR